MSRHRQVLSLWISAGLVIGVGGPGNAQAFHVSDVVFVGDVGDVPDRFGAARLPAAGPETTLPTDAPTSEKNSTAGLLVLIGVVLIIGTGALVLTLKYRKR